MHRKRLLSWAVVFSTLIMFGFVSCGGSSSDPLPGNSAPSVLISAPAADAAPFANDPISFAGSCTDSEEGALIGTALVWTSDLDGAIGTGESFSSSALAAGDHQITLTCTDTTGGAGTAVVSLTVRAPALPDSGQTTGYTDTFGEDADYDIHPRALPSWMRMATRSSPAPTAGRWSGTKSRV